MNSSECTSAATPSRDSVAEADAFRYRSAVLGFWVAGINCSLIFLMSVAGVFKAPAISVGIIFLFGLISLGLGVLAWRLSRYWRIYVGVFNVALFALLLACGILITADPMRFTWHFAAVFFAFLTGSPRSGMLAYLGAMGTITGVMRFHDASPLAPIVTICLALSVTSLFGYLLSRRFELLIHKLDASRRELKRLAAYDYLTGLPNRLALKERFVALRDETRLSVTLCDIDHFKRINDTHGHAGGDEILRRVADCLTREVASAGFVARIGGEEFCILWPAMTLECVLAHNERLRQTLERERWRLNDQVLEITVSFGVTHSRYPHPGLGPLLAAADQALYTSKHQGRNRVSVHGDDDASRVHVMEDGAI